MVVFGRCRSGFGSTQLWKICLERLHTGGGWSQKNYILITEPNWTMTKMQINFFSTISIVCLLPALRSLSIILFACCFYPSFIDEKNNIFYNLVIPWRMCKIYSSILVFFSKSILIFTSHIIDLLLFLDLQILNKVIEYYRLYCSFSFSIFCCLVYEVLSHLKYRNFKCNNKVLI
jgi:hypothetical protein